MVNLSTFFDKFTISNLDQYYRRSLLVTVIVEEDQINTSVSSPGAFIWQDISK